MLSPKTEKKKEKRDKVLPPCRVSEAEHSSIKSKAKEIGLSLSEYQRRACLNAEVVVRESAVEVKAVSQLSAIGNNLNQLVKKIHIHDEADTQKMRHILETIDTLIMGLVRGS